MKTKIVDWFWKHRATIGYTIGFCNIISGIMNVAIGNVVGGLFWFGIGLFIVWDVKTYK